MWIWAQNKSIALLHFFSFLSYLLQHMYTSHHNHNNNNKNNNDINSTKKLNNCINCIWWLLLRSELVSQILHATFKWAARRKHKQVSRQAIKLDWFDGVLFWPVCQRNAKKRFFLIFLIQNLNHISNIKK